MKIERVKNRGFNRLTNFEKPNGLGLKWRFFLFAIILKNSSTMGYTFIFFLYFFEILSCMSPTYYPILSQASIQNNKNAISDCVFPYSDALSFITPTFLSTETWMTLVFLFCLLTIICFLVCLYDPSFARYLHIILNIRIHFVFIPFITGTFGFAIDMVSIFINETSIAMPLAILNIICYPFYLFVISLLSFADSNSLINPCKIAAQWFTGFSYWHPLFIAFYSCVCYQSVFIPKYVSYPLLAVCSLLGICIFIYIFLTMPMMLFISNEILSTRIVVSVTLMIESIFTLEFNFASNNIIAIIPVYIIVAYLIIHFFFNRRRISLQQLLTQIETDEQISNEALQTTLSPLTRKYSLIAMIKEGLLSGNKTIMSNSFIQYCLERYPDCEWFLCYIGLLYGVIMNSHPSIYRFLLHLISINIFSAPAEFVLFQYVYCYMQTSQNLSPMILRRLTKFRQTTQSYVLAHRKYWLAAATSGHSSKSIDLRTFNQASLQLFRLFIDLQHQAKILKLMFPFCPVVRCELCLFAADLKHNIVKADKEYQIASSLLNPDEEYVTSSLFQGFSIFFPGSRKVETPQFSTGIKNLYPDNAVINNYNEAVQTEYKFLSFQEHYDDAHRHGFSLNVNDSYITFLSHTFTMSKTKPQVEPRIDSFRLVSAYIVVSIVIIAYILLFIFHHFIDPYKSRQYNDIESINLILEATNLFRRNVYLVENDVILLTNIVNHTFTDFTYDYGLFFYIREHLFDLESDLYSYRYFLNSLEPFKSNSNITAFCDNINCTFSFLFGALHSKCLYFLRSDLANETLVEGIDFTLVNISTNMQKIINNIYRVINDLYITKLNNLVDFTTKSMDFFSGIEILIAILGSIFTGIIVSQMKKNISDAIRTAQPPIIQYISCQFDKILSFDQYQLPELVKYSRSNSIFPLIFMFLFLLVYPIYSVISIQRVRNFEIALIDNYRYDEITYDLQFLYFSYAKLEYTMKASSLENIDEFASIIESPHSCYHDIFDDNSTNSSVSIQFNSQYRLTINYFIHSIAMIASFICFIFYLWCAYLDIKSLYFGKFLLKYFPHTATHSNPVFTKLLQGKSITSKDVSHFTKNINVLTSDIKFFSILYYDHSGSITRIVGKAKKYLKMTPKSIDKICRFAVNKCPDMKEEIVSFFEKKTENESINLSFYPGHEISIIFSKNPDSLIIKDDSHHFETNSKERMAKKLSKALDNNISTDLTTINLSVILMIASQNHSTLINIKNLLSNKKENGKDEENEITSSSSTRGNTLLKNLVVVDTRNFIISSLIIAHDDPKSSCRNTLNIIDMIKETIGSIQELKIVLTFGGPISFFDSIKNQTTKSRFIGQCYEIAKMLMNIAEEGKPLITKEFCDNLDDAESMTFEEKEIGFNTKVLLKS